MILIIYSWHISVLICCTVPFTFASHIQCGENDKTSFFSSILKEQMKGSHFKLFILTFRKVVTARSGKCL